MLKELKKEGLSETMLKIILNTIIIFAIILLDSNISYANNSSYILSSLKEAQRISDATDQSILLIFGSKNCPYCTKLYNDLIDIDKKYIDTYIICYIDLDKQEHKKFKEEYEITLIPDSRIIRQNKTISSMRGYKKTEYLEWLYKNK